MVVWICFRVAIVAIVGGVVVVVVDERGVGGPAGSFWCYARVIVTQNEERQPGLFLF